ncbi:MAG: TIGR00159 family protein [Zetaproteobacteria bacterium CG12_big_fil_rev_8_21_14_0_65_55_1124]|nr:MAG: TIGR00159 family protein [Zetaproteobacteria bacterium CG1_02_55_237]PIS20116.1 MAG: TIGR00159 family protein [Zetaproteobacteria bacterium CG08_land_8_20_14_0_20_55_17]PIW42575.1 MAG: TIGR00159 family protein [Zetaproteobacteria bacterium CG12_big_fil_rev_8_21_14_0_65_55_1124]PIY53218.1 MAG: TIGR00159 family protein [Zetaproteobacteria bacterium CG_4_10_14_0_8_um_filter_55_43]PIZ38516.1 MAG: TIGR00159 family protein [Zetaproteobacteria bacterium CG_4_10_14_0_2_um_filter_55_20]PJB82676
MQNWDFSFLDIIDIALVAVFVYYVLRLIRGTRAVQMLIGLAVFVVVYELARFFGLLTVEWIFGQFFSAFIVILVVLFQHEIRRALMRVGANPLAYAASPTQMVDALVESAFSLAHLRWGALLVIERETGLKHLFDSGVEMDAPVRSDIMQALFNPQAPMHDGAVVIHPHVGESGRIVAARVLLPLAQANALSGEFGTRHRAAIGITEESDALVVVVSEETGNVRLADAGTMSDPVDANGLRQLLIAQLSPYAGSNA